ncbi:MAG: hypothetical protein NC180_11015 [Muribaculaceae bacterium]|nr:hypothetical protein [Roseburia sp.]MCM1432003.1 hypothetical protein [Muribaculaceae bacterium]MCM1493743.1 hypothetical protein [Muribaculaceae bacterium]
MKKFMVLLLMAALALQTAACGNQAPASTENESGQAGVPEFDSTEDIINKIYEIKPVDLNMGNIPVDLTDENSLLAYTGLTPEDADKLVEATASEPMMGQACSIVVAEVNHAGDAPELAQKMADQIDQRKWVCMEADNLRVVTCDRYVLLVMVMSDLADTVTVDEIVDAFTEVCGYTDGEYEKQ